MGRVAASDNLVKYGFIVYDPTSNRGTRVPCQEFSIVCGQINICGLFLSTASPEYRSIRMPLAPEGLNICYTYQKPPHSND